MATVTGTLSDFRLSTLSAYEPVIIFTPSSIGLLGARILARRPIEVRPNAAGYFEVDLASTDLVTPASWFDIAIRWLDPDGQQVSIDHTNDKLFVPYQDGTIADLLRAPSNNQLHVFMQDTEPDPWPPGTAWLNTLTWDFNRKDA